MSIDGEKSWRSNTVIALSAFIITVVGGSLICLFWIRDLRTPSVTFLGSGSDLSVLIADGPSRLLLATGDNPIAFENAFLATQPLFARRVDLLLVSGDAASLRVPETARKATVPRQLASLGALPPSPEFDALQPLGAISGHQHVRLSNETTVWIETQTPIGADPLATEEAWRLIIEHQGTRISIYSDGDAVPLFPAEHPGSIVAVTGSDPLAFMADGEGVVFVANATQIDGPALREALSVPDADSSWLVRVHPGDAVRMLLSDDGVDVPAWAAIEVLRES